MAEAATPNPEVPVPPAAAPAPPPAAPKPPAPAVAAPRPATAVAAAGAAVVVPKPAAPAVKPPLPGAPPEGQYTRRDFLNLLGWSWLSAALGGWTLASLRFMFPTVLYEPNPIFKAGFPRDFPLDNGKPAVSDRWQKEFRTWIVSKPEGMYAFLAKCTHLGCTPRWEVNDQRFKCPCHGSNFNIEGQVVAGPAPEPLKRCGISLGVDGQLVVNRSQLSNNPSDVVSDAYFLKKEKFS